MEKRFTLANHQLILLIAITLYCLLFGSISVWKYLNFGYNALDLAIINQVFFNSSQGHWFASSIHPPSYLGDHVEVFLLFLLPLYLLFKSPITLLLLQTLVLGLSAWPLYLFAKAVLNKNWGLFFGLAWLFNPFVHNINLFEFHFLPFAVFFILYAAYWLQQKKFWLFIITSSLALLVREDVALVIAMFGILSLLERRTLKWIVTPIVLAGGYFLLALKITSLVSPIGQYKFLVYYAWLGNSWLAMIKNSLLEPWRLFAHLAKFGNLEFLIGLLLPFTFLPLLAPRWLLLGLFIAVQFMLGAPGGSGTLLELHYSALMLPALVISTVYALKRITGQSSTNSRAIKLIKKEPRLSLIILVVTVFYTSLTLGPLWGVAHTLARDGLIWPQTAAKQALLKKIPPDAAVAASYEFLAPLSSRANLASLNYVFLGQQQFLSRDYALPPATQYIVLDYRDLVTYQLQYGQNDFYREQYQEGLVRWPSVLDDFGLVELSGSVALYQRGQTHQQQLVSVPQTTFTINQPQVVQLGSELTFLGHNQKSKNVYELFWSVTQAPSATYRLVFNLKKDDTVLATAIYPLAYDRYATATWPVGQIVTTVYDISFNQAVPAGTYDLTMTLITIKSGGLEINRLRSTMDVIDEMEKIGPPIPLDQITF